MDKPTVEKWERNRILDIPKLYHSLMALRLERKTLEALSDTINEAITHSVQEAKAGLVQEIEGMKKDKPQPPTPSQYVKTCLNIMERERVSAYNQAIDDVKLAILKGVRYEET